MKSNHTYEETMAGVAYFSPSLLPNAANVLPIPITELLLLSLCPETFLPKARLRSLR